MKKLIFAVVAALAMLSSVTSQVSAQTTVTQTTLGSAITGTASNTITLASVSGVTAGYGLFVDREAMSVVSVNSTALSVRVVRGSSSTVAATHASGAIVYVGPTSGVTGQGPFQQADPGTGSCAASSEQYSLRINVTNGRIWQCTNSQWMNVIDAFQWFGPGSCNSAVSASSTGTNGMTSLTAGRPIPVVSAQTSAQATHYFVCSIPVPSRTNVVKSAYVVDTEFYYGVQTTALGTQSAVLASGTMNGTSVFTYVTYPTPGAGETATGIAEFTRADSGTLTITPVVASFNTATTTSGEFYSVKFTPATPIAVATDHRQLTFTVTLANGAGATITNSPGFLVHYRTLQAGF